MGTNPQLTANYHLSSSSPCINRGTGTPGTNPYPSDDLDGITRTGFIDIGCYENNHLFIIHFSFFLPLGRSNGQRTSR
jgi:hypothetical protein